MVRHWLRQGIDGWRLDVTDSLSPDFMRAIRAAAKAEDPDSIVIVEQWGDSSPWLLGDQGDSTMDYRFRRAVIGARQRRHGRPGRVARGAHADRVRRRRCRAMQEDYPAAAWDALLHMVDSHDTTRILWTLTPGDRQRHGQVRAPAALAEGDGAPGHAGDHPARRSRAWPRSSTATRSASPATTTRTIADRTRGRRRTPRSWTRYRTLALLRAQSRGAARRGPDVPAADDAARHARLPAPRGRRRRVVVALNLADQERPLRARRGRPAAGRDAARPAPGRRGSAGRR